MFALLFVSCLASAALKGEELRITSNPPGATIEIDGKVALNGVDHGNYCLLKDKEFNVTLNPEAKVFTAGLAQTSAAPQMELASAELSIESIVDKTSSAVLKLSTAEGTGSGFLVTTGGVVVTNAHVVGNSNEVTAKNTQQQQFNGRVVYKNPALDLARVKLVVAGTPLLPMTTLASIRVGQSVVAIRESGSGDAEHSDAWHRKRRRPLS